MLLKALVFCSVVLEDDDTYFAVCEGRRSLMVEEAVRIVERDRMSIFCTAYLYEESGNHDASFVVVCE